ncbi:MAG: hypothetical protein KDD55_10940 [Bdellovibrionales bacterium]|nr:hypothetical protein [Bdellovibrionales bacterium]
MVTRLRQLARITLLLVLLPNTAFAWISCTPLGTNSHPELNLFFEPSTTTNEGLIGFTLITYVEDFDYAVVAAATEVQTSSPWRGGHTSVELVPQTILGFTPRHGFSSVPYYSNTQITYIPCGNGTAGAYLQPACDIVNSGGTIYFELLARSGNLVMDTETIECTSYN